MSVPININHNDNADQCSSFIDYSESTFTSGQERQRNVLFKYNDMPQTKAVDEEAKTNIKFHQKRRNTLSRDRVPTRKG